MSPFVLTREALLQPWRLWTCHALQFGWTHALLNLGALAVPAALVRPRVWPRMALALLVLAPVLGLAILLHLGDAEYRGASGLACAAWALAGVHLARARESRMEGLVLLGLLSAKLLAEIVAGATFLPGGPGWVSLPAAHRWGAALGVVGSPLLAAGEGRKPKA